MAAPDYKKILEDIKKKNKGNSTAYIQFEDGDTIIRILPGHPNMEGFFATFPYHQKGKGDSFVKVPCLNREPGDDNCEVCRSLAELRDSDDKADKKTYKDQMSKDRYFFGAIVRKPEGKGEVEEVAECGTMLLEEILKLLINPDYEDLLDPAKGRDVTVNKSGKDMETKYKVLPRPNPSPIIPGKPKASAAFIGTDADDTKLQDLSLLGDQFKDEPEKCLLIWEQGWKALKDSDDTSSKTTKKAATATSTKVTKKVAKPVEEAPDEEGEETVDLTKPLKARDPITGDKRYKQPDGTITTADGRKSPKGLGEDERPSKPSKAYLKEFPEPVEEEEEEAEEVEESEEEEEETEPTPVKKTTAKTTKKAAVEPDEDDGLEELEDILAKHSGKAKK